MTTNTTQILSELADREAIKECLYRYCRGIDRRDPDILRTAYWPDAIDTHLMFKGNIEEFIAWAMERTAKSIVPPPAKVCVSVTVRVGQSAAWPARGVPAKATNSAAAQTWTTLILRRTNRPDIVLPPPDGARRLRYPSFYK